jgi:hypothetical protein
MQTDMKKLIIDFRDFANPLSKWVYISFSITTHKEICKKKKN